MEWDDGIFSPSYIILLKWKAFSCTFLVSWRSPMIIKNFVQEIDLRIGASFTRFQTMLLKDAFVLDDTGDDRNIILSYGPCQVLHYRVWTEDTKWCLLSSWCNMFFALQFPTLGFIVERFWEIQAHEPEEFWTINCSHTSDEGTASFGWM